MKKLLIGLFVLSVVLLSSTYFVGEMVENETQKMFAKKQQQGFSSKLISYDKQFLKATAISQVTVTLEGETPIVVTVTSSIKHYPFKALIKNKISLADPELAEKVQNYFASENWVSSREEINLLGQLTGQLNVLAGSYKSETEQFATKALQLDYQVNLHDYSGLVNLNWAGLDAQTSDGDFSVDSVQLRSNFNLFSAGNEYDYFTEIGKIVIQQESAQSQLQGLELRGSSRSGEQTDTIDSSNEWKISSYQIANGTEKVFTNNHIKLDIKGLYSPALNLLSSGSGDQQEVGKALTELMAHGAQLTLSKLSSQTPWGAVDGYLTITLQQGATLSEVVVNPFMLLDYVSGNGNLFLPEALLEEPTLSESLKMGLMTGFLKQQDQKLSLETQFEQGELTVNGRVIPL